MQLVICFESRSSAETDYIYVHEFIRQFYNEHFRTFKIDKVPLKTKGNYDRVENKIKNKLRKYKFTHKNEKQFVLFCLDTDYGMEGSPKLNTKIIDYCKSKGYYLIWFHRDVEEVFLKRRVDVNEKTKTSLTFLKENLIKKVDANNLIEVDILSAHFGRSNLKEILDEIFGKTFKKK